MSQALLWRAFCAVGDMLLLSRRKRGECLFETKMDLWECAVKKTCLVEDGFPRLLND